jgi:hypothetical protein
VISQNILGSWYKQEENQLKTELGIFSNSLVAKSETSQVLSSVIICNCLSWSALTWGGRQPLTLVRGRWVDSSICSTETEGLGSFHNQQWSVPPQKQGLGQGFSVNSQLIKGILSFQKILPLQVFGVDTFYVTTCRHQKKDKIRALTTWGYGQRE